MHNATDGFLDEFIDEGWIDEILYEVKSGKEATVFCCRAGSAAPNGFKLIAAKVYRCIQHRSFKNDGVYQAGRVEQARNSRARRALRSHSTFGRSIQNTLWAGHEWETMSHLYEAGADVPEPLKCGEHALLMPFLGDEDGAAPILNDAELSRNEVERVIDILIGNIELMLDLHRVHGDLSPYNAMYWKGVVTIIDFPQAIDPRLNPAAQELLRRDVENVCRWAAKHGVRRDAGRIVSDLWSRFVVGDLG